ncbi:glycogen synthase [Streptomyces sp. YGL11-2]|uniref:glycogen synthase n=1 Tax=Streptomyces sp. YGL11-2 TaxID=3414028 RepID=UPI003CF09D85
MRCLYLTQELAPYFVEGGLGQTARALPLALEQDHGLVHDLVVPYYPWLVDDHGLHTERVWSTKSLAVGGVSAPAQVDRLLVREGPGEVYLVRSGHWYDRAGMYRDAQYLEYADATARAAFFGACTAAWLTSTGRGYDLVHGNDWQSGPALAHLRSMRGASPRPALLLNVHSAEYTGVVAPGEISSLSLPEYWHRELAAAGDEASLLLLGALAADAVTTGSPSYAQELLAQTADSALGGALNSRPLTGIVAGIDTELWRPEARARLTVPYGPQDVRRGKAANKRLLQERCGLKADPAVPLLGVCSRIVPEKGTDLLLEAIAPLVRDGACQLVVMGQGDAALVSALVSLARDVPLGMHHVPAFDQDSAWLTYAGADFTVMPSRAEPCGLNQLIAMTYGTVPVVSAVGGLRDTVIDLDSSNEGTGFVLPELTAGALRHTVLRAARWLSGPADQVEAVRRRVMAQDWSWDRSARDTAELYTRTANARAAQL